MSSRFVCDKQWTLWVLSQPRVSQDKNKVLEIPMSTLRHWGKKSTYERVCLAIFFLSLLLHSDGRWNETGKEIMGAKSLMVWGLGVKDRDGNVRMITNIKGLWKIWDLLL